VGRTGRAGALGLASTLVSGSEVGELRQMERVLKLRIERKHFGTGGAPRPRENTLSSRTLTRLPGEVFA
jgi:superfamily II DNA/RNA helicase